MTQPIFDPASMNRILLETWLCTQGYKEMRWIDETLCGLHEYAYTCGIVVGLSVDTYERRYCYQDRAEAAKELLRWDGNGHPPGNWIKVKGRMNGIYLDEFNPHFSKV
jgi:hypothetical protein